MRAVFKSVGWAVFAVVLAIESPVAAQEPDGDGGTEFDGRADTDDGNDGGDESVPDDGTDSDSDTVTDARERAGDTDGDSIVDKLDNDDDGDGVPTLVERGTGALAVDTDGDGRADYLSDDDDGDGLPTRTERGTGETPIDTDGDAKPDYVDVDDDNDSVWTAHERGSPSEPADSDRDGLPDIRDPDDDNDGVLTKDEHADPNADGDPEDAISTANARPDYLNDDDDDDGISTRDELPITRNTDGDATPNDLTDDVANNSDAIPDYLDDDDDNDGLYHEGGFDNDRDGLPDNRDPDDDNDSVPSRLEIVSLIDTDGDGLPDPKDDDDDGDGMLTQQELGEGGAALPRDSNGDKVPDYRAADDDGDGLPSKEERTSTVLDHDGDGTPDFLDADDDNDTLATRDERGWTPDPDLDGVPSWLDLDSDGDGLTDQQEGTADRNANGIPDFLDATSLGRMDGGVVRDGGFDGAVADASGIDSGGSRPSTTAPADDDGCSAAPRSRTGGPHGLGWLSLTLTALWFRRRRTRSELIAIGLMVLSMAALGCGDDEGDDDVFRLDATTPSLDASFDASRDAGPAPDGGWVDPDSAVASSECTVGMLFEQPIEESSERGWTALQHDGKVHVAYVVATCEGVGAPSGTRIDYRSLRSTGAPSEAIPVTASSAGECRVVGAPALGVGASGKVELYFADAVSGVLELWSQDVAAALSPQRVTDDAVTARDEELRTVAATFGAGPLLAYINRTSLIGGAQLVTRRPGLAENEIVPLAEKQDPMRLALVGSAAGGSLGGLLGWVSERATGSSIRLQALNPAGAAIGTSVQLSDVVGGLSNISLAADKDSAAVVYAVVTQSVPELRFRALGTDGSVGEREVKLTSANRRASSPSIAPYASGYVVAFRDVPMRDDVPAALQLSFIALNGMVGGERRLADAARSGGDTRVFVMNDGRLIVAWSDSVGAGRVLKIAQASCAR